MKVLQASHQDALLSEIFPGLVINAGNCYLKYLRLQLPQLYIVATNIQKEHEFFIHLRDGKPTLNNEYELENSNSPFQIFKRTNSPTVIYLSKSMQICFDARWFTKTCAGENVIVLLQCKLSNNNTLAQLFPPSLFNMMKKCYEGFKVIYILITNSETSFGFTQECSIQYQNSVGLMLQEQ